MIYHHCSVVPCQHSETWTGPGPGLAQCQFHPGLLLPAELRAFNRKRDRENSPLHLTFNKSLSEILANALTVLSNQERK